MKFNRLQQFNVIVFLFLAILLLFFAFRGVDYKLIRQGFANANYAWVAIALLVGGLSHIIRALRWQLLIEPLGYKPSLLNTLGAIMIGYLANIAFPRLGEITRCGSLKKTDGIPFEPLVGTVIVERVFDFICMLLLLIIVFFHRIELFGIFIKDIILVPIFHRISALFASYPLTIILAVLILVTLLALIRRNVFGEGLHRWMSKLFHGTMSGLKTAYTIRKRFTFLLYTILLWGLYWLMTWLLVFTTGPTSHLSPVDGLFLLVIGSMGMAVPVQGGFGAFHIITAMGLGVYGITREAGLVFAIISHESQMLFVILAGLVFMCIFIARRKRKVGGWNADTSTALSTNDADFRGRTRMGVD